MVWWTERPWWLRWFICLAPAAAGLMFKFAFNPNTEISALWAWWILVSAVLSFVNLLLTWGEILDAITGRKK